ncbi:MAG TPA: DUF481 domain-containing protein [Polyangiaceae bacterium]|jgi:putative salt-induced outer membrane protein YdiY|nr:DUF481 domain-containing protein [Polyangiaceae bacterium]
MKSKIGPSRRPRRASPGSRASRATLVVASCFATAVLPLAFASNASAQSATGAPPADATALVAAPKDNVTAPTPDKPSSGTNISLSAGGQLATGDSRLLAMTANGALDSRWGSDGVGLSILGNYGESATPGNAIVETTANVQGRVRYDRYLIDQLSLFLINTGRNDRFQGLDFRYNLDPGAKYLFFNAATNALWIEAGYDFQYDVRRDDARVQSVAMGAPPLPLLAKHEVDHSMRLYAGFKHSFNEEVTLSTGVEYIQSFTDTKHQWLNYDLLFAAKIGAGLAIGLGFNARYDSAPLPEKKNLDTATTLSLIYAFSDAAPPKPADAPLPVPCPPPPPAPEAAPPPAAAPAPATIPAPDAPSTMSPPAPAP